VTELLQCLKSVTDLFDSLGMTYAVMGGLAVRIYGISRPTFDIDITVAIDPPKVHDVLHAVKKLGFVANEVSERGWVDRVAGMPIVKIQSCTNDQSIDVDLFLAESAFQIQLLSRRRQAQANGFTTWFVSPEDLILLKLAASRPRDLGDVGDIFFMQGQLDEDHMRRWAKELKISDQLEQALAEHRDT
jgi:predicted nucleotidyltransferase